MTAPTKQSPKETTGLKRPPETRKNAPVDVNVSFSEEYLRKYPVGENVQAATVRLSPNDSEIIINLDVSTVPASEAASIYKSREVALQKLGGKGREILPLPRRTDQCHLHY